MRMLILSAAAALAACTSPVGANQANGAIAAPDAALPEGAAILDEAQRDALLRQCSRSTPPPGESGWRPGAADIVAMEAAVAAALRQRRGAGEPDWARFPSIWRRQYVGVVRGGRRYIYGNAFPVDPFAASDPDRWRRETALICDGGPSFFGVEYDVEAGRITHIAFNGSA